MPGSVGFLGLACGFILLAGVGVGHAAVQTASLPSFSRMEYCGPFNVLLSPSPSGQYVIATDAEKGVQDATTVNVNNGVLSLGTKQDFTASQPVKINVQLPAGALQSVKASGAGFTLVVDSGFSADSFDAEVGGAANLVLKGLNAQQLQVSSSGVGALVANGTFQTVQAASSGTGQLYLLGSPGAVVLQTQGVATVGISGSQSISGQLQGIPRISFDSGTCSIQGLSSVFGSPCTQVAQTQPPTIDENWTCGLTVKGAFSCAGSTGGAATSSADCTA